MCQANANIMTIEIKVAWWLLHVYLPLLVFFYEFAARYISPDIELNTRRVEAIMAKGVSIYINGHRIA